LEREKRGERTERGESVCWKKGQTQNNAQQQQQPTHTVVGRQLLNVLHNTTRLVTQAAFGFGKQQPARSDISAVVVCVLARLHLGIDNACTDRQRVGERVRQRVRERESERGRERMRE